MRKEKFLSRFWIIHSDISGLTMEAKMEKDADSMVGVKPAEYAASEYSSSSEPPPVSIVSLQVPFRCLAI